MEALDIIIWPISIDLGDKIIPKIRMTHGNIKRAVGLKRQGIKTREIEVLEQQKFIGYTVLSKLNDLGLEKCPNIGIGWTIKLCIFMNGIIRNNRKHGDIDNIEKVVLDGLTGVLYKNDKSVLSLSSIFYDSFFSHIDEFKDIDRLFVSFNPYFYVNVPEQLPSIYTKYLCKICSKRMDLLPIGSQFVCRYCIDNDYLFNLQQFFKEKK